MHKGLALKNVLTAERLRQVLHYDPEIGVFTRLVQKPNRYASREFAGGNVARTGYARVSVDRIQYQAHRLAWLYVYGRWPNAEVDHINGDRSDNRLVVAPRRCVYGDSGRSVKRRERASC